MAIETYDFSPSLFSHEFSTAGADSDIVAQVTPQFNQAKTKASFIVVATGLDANTRLTLTSGNTDIYTEHGALVDSCDEAIIIDVANGSNTYIVNLYSFYIGFGFEKLTATTGTVKILAAL